MTPDRQTELAQQFPIGAHLTLTAPWPCAGWVVEHGIEGIVLDDRTDTRVFLAWRTLDTVGFRRRE